MEPRNFSPEELIEVKNIPPWEKQMIKNDDLSIPVEHVVILSYSEISYLAEPIRSAELFSDGSIVLKQKDSVIQTQQQRRIDPKDLISSLNKMGLLGLKQENMEKRAYQIGMNTGSILMPHIHSKTDKISIHLIKYKQELSWEGLEEAVETCPTFKELAVFKTAIDLIKKSFDQQKEVWE